MNSTYRVVFLGEAWSLTVFVELTEADLAGLPLTGTVADEVATHQVATNKADEFIHESCGTRPSEFSYDVEVENWAHAKA